MDRVGGILSVKVGGEVHKAKGAFTYNIGQPLREAVVGVDGVHGFKETPQVGFIEGSITDRADLKLKDFLNLTNVSIMVKLRNGKTISMPSGTYAQEGTVSSEEGEIPVRFIGDCEEI